MNKLANSPLGKESPYTAHYQPNLLYTIPREIKRKEIHVPDTLPFYGVDIWNAYELSWLNAKGKPQVALAEFIFPCTAPHLIESKSFKLYLNSFNNTKFANRLDVASCLEKDLSLACGDSVKVMIKSLEDNEIFQNISGYCLDQLDIDCNEYSVEPDYLTTENEIIIETVYSHLLKSNCLVTNQPDWGSVVISYTGKKIHAPGLLRYIVSFRNHNEFHEQCVERIFMDIMQYCQPEKLTVYARYTRRGGLDINPYRTTEAEFNVENLRLTRQ